MMKKVLVKSRAIFLALLLVIFSLFGVIAFLVLFYGKVLPGTYVWGEYIGGLTQKEAENVLASTLALPENITIQIRDGESVSQYVMPLSAIEASVDYAQTVNIAYNRYRTGSWVDEAKNTLRSIFKPVAYNLVINFNKEKLEEQVTLISSQLPSPPEEPSLIIAEDKVLLNPGKKGATLDVKNLGARIISETGNNKKVVSIQTKELDPTLTPLEAENFIKRGNTLVTKSLVLKSNGQEFSYEKTNLISLIAPHGGYRLGTLSPSLNEIAALVKTEPKNPVFTYEPVGAGVPRVKEFSPAKNGAELDIEKVPALLESGLGELEKSSVDSLSLDLPLKLTPPEYSTEEVNNLGIKELIGIGTSKFQGSIPSRVHNVGLAASRINGVLIAPGETFSFTKALGDISVYTGYKQAYVIQGNQTVLGDGGGVCQVSTTFFRAALNAGLPIVERHPHSYRVGYYEQDSAPGIDATIYSPSVDIKIKNDTPAHILIQTIMDSKKMTLRFELYGTSDGRKSAVTKPVINSVTPPPDDLYIDDPTLPTGQVKQIDHKAWGAKVSFDYSVEKNGEVIFTKTFNSNYQPWQAKFLRGTGPAI